MLRTFYVVMGAFSLGNAAWMLLAPASWFVGLPAAVPDTGAFNAHLIRDVGVAFGVAAAGFVWCAGNLRRCYPIHIGLALFFGGHALVHVADLLSGRLLHHHWWVDLPGVFIPALLLVMLSLPRVWRRLNPEHIASAA